jgi:hypothetical protein
VKPGCERYRIELTALRRGEEPELAASELEEHLAGCEECRLAGRRGGQLFALLDSLQPEPRAGGAQRLRLAISTGRYTTGTAGHARRAVPLPLAAAIAAAAFLAALYLGSKLEFGRGPSPAPEVAVLTAARGVGPGEGRAGARETGSALAPGSRLVVASDGRAALVMARGARLELWGGSAAEVLAGDRLRLERGMLLAAVAKGATPFTVVTPAAEVRTLGTRFIVEVRAGGTRVTVLEGRVRLASTGAAAGGLELAALQTSEVAAGAAPSAPRPASAGELAWGPVPRRRHLELELRLGGRHFAIGRRVPAGLRLVNRSSAALRVDGVGRGRSSYFVRVEDPDGRIAHFAPAVTSARVNGVRSVAPVVEIPAGGCYELELDLGAFAERPGLYRLSAVYLEAVASESTDWSGALESAPREVSVEAPPASPKEKAEALREIERIRQLIELSGGRAAE